MPDRLWKQCERAIARRLGGVRVGPTGASGPDILTPWACIEVKERQTLPRWLTDALRQAEEGATDGRVGVLVLHQKGEPHARDVACLRLADLERLLDGLGNGSRPKAGDVP
jgi:hypothetical protein